MASGLAQMAPTPYIDGNDVFYSAAKGVASVDIMKGALHSYAQALGRVGVGVAATSFYDTLTFFAPAGFVGGTVQVTETLHVSGAVTGEHMDLNFWAGYWSASISDLNHRAGQQYGSNHPGPTNFDVSLTLTLPVVNGMAQDRIGFSLVTYVDAGCNECAVTMDFSNTATVTQTLPAGWSYGSASGVFLAPVPEPATKALSLAGLGLTAFVARRRRREPRPLPVTAA
ncbi:MAG: PEP-CTERM sorting domain-containing protein [Burkholderiaceae bacterium]|nr:PEP-CTERM sorting domain-containing protein [Burkholderiaceae bacterium]